MSHAGFEDVSLQDFLGDDLSADELSDIAAIAQKRGIGGGGNPFVRMSEPFRGRVPTDSAAVHQRLTEEVTRICLTTGCRPLEATIRLRSTPEGRGLLLAWQQSIRSVRGE